MHALLVTGRLRAANCSGGHLMHGNSYPSYAHFLTMSQLGNSQTAILPEGDHATTMLPPVVPPVSLYANLPQEWPLARLSVQVRHISVLLRVTLFRRVAELNFRGVDFRTLPREVMRNIVYDFNNIGGELARRLASLFAFLKPDPNAGTQADTLGTSALC